ncbi:MAG: DinB family protein [Phycisphaerales bacterium]
MTRGLGTTFDAYAPFERELAGLEAGVLLDRFRTAVDRLDPRVFSLDDEQLDMAFLGDAGVGKWPIRVVLGHLAETEVVQTHRIRRALAEDRPVVQTWDEQAFVDSGIYGGGIGATFGGGAIRPPVGAFVAAVHTLRQWTASTLELVPEGAWERVAMHPEFGELSVRAMVCFEVWHFEHHARFVNAKVSRLLGGEPGAGRGEE